jgi:hypothetical protein
MGCSNHKGVRITPRTKSNMKLPKFTLKIENPTNQEVVLFSCYTESDELPLMQIMNAVAFDDEKGSKFDGNFISVLNEDKTDFEYYVQRLLGIEIDND